MSNGKPSKLLVNLYTKVDVPPPPPMLLLYSIVFQTFDVQTVFVKVRYTVHKRYQHLGVYHKF